MPHILKSFPVQKWGFTVACNLKVLSANKWKGRHLLIVIVVDLFPFIVGLEMFISDYFFKVL